MTDTTNPNREQAREVLPADISRIAGCQVGSDRTRRLVDFILARDALPTPEAERVEILTGMAHVRKVVGDLVTLHHRLLSEAEAGPMPPQWSQGQAMQDAQTIMYAMIEMERAISAMTVSKHHNEHGVCDPCDLAGHLGHEAAMMPSARQTMINMLQVVHRPDLLGVTGGDNDLTDQERSDIAFVTELIKRTSPDASMVNQVIQTGPKHPLVRRLREYIEEQMAGRAA